MDWSNERYVRVYTRDTVSWKLLDWRGRLVLMMLLRKVDRAGVLDVGDDGVLGLAAILELPLDITQAGIEQLTASRGGTPTVIETGSAYVIPHFIEAQEASQSDPQRKRESRSRKRDLALAAGRKLLLASADDRAGHETGHDRHTRSHAVTPSLILAKPDQDLSLPRARDAATPLPPPPLPSSSWHDRKRWWDAMLSADARLRASGIEPHAPQLPAAPAGENEKNVAACARQLADAGFDAEAVDAKMLHIVAVAEAEAQREQSRTYFKPALIWDPKRANRAADTSIQEARRPRPLKRGEVAPAAPRRPDKPAPVVIVSDADRAEAAAELEAAKARLFGTPTPDEPDDGGTA